MSTYNKTEFGDMVSIEGAFQRGGIGEGCKGSLAAAKQLDYPSLRKKGKLSMRCVDETKGSKKTFSFFSEANDVRSGAPFKR
jgi:hypothetical protein